MSISIGIDCMPGQYRVCRVEQGQLAEFHRFETTDELLAAVRQLCARYPEPTIVVALDGATPFVSLAALTDDQLERPGQRSLPTPPFSELTSILRTLRALSSQSYCAPSVEYLPSVPPHRCLLRPALGSAGVLVGIVQTPVLSQFFGCTPLGPVAWSGVLGSTAGATAISALAPNWLSKQVAALEPGEE